MLMAWSASMLLFLLLGYRLIGIYRLRYDSLEGQQRMAFVKRYHWVWAMLALLWGSLVVLTYRRADMGTQFVCGVMVVGQGLFSLVAFSSYLPVSRRYSHALVLAVAIGLVINTLGDPTPEGWRNGMGLMALPALYGWLLMTAGRRLHRVYRSSFERQFSNQELIDSLTTQTRASLRAVATKNRFLAFAAHDLRQPMH